MRILIRKNFLKIFCNAREQGDGALYHICIHAKELAILMMESSIMQGGL